MSNIDILTREGGALASLDRSVINNATFRSFVNNIQLRKFDDGSFVNMLLELNSSVLTSSNFTGGILNLHTKDDDIITNGRFSDAILVMSNDFLRSNEFRQFVNRLDPSLLERRDGQFSFSGQLKAEYIDALVRNFSDEVLQNKNLNSFINSIDVSLFSDGSFSNFITSTEDFVITDSDFTGVIEAQKSQVLTNGKFTDEIQQLTAGLRKSKEFSQVLAKTNPVDLAKRDSQYKSILTSDVVERNKSTFVKQVSSTNRNENYQHVLRSQEFSIRLSDYGTEDGDIVNVLLNGRFQSQVVLTNSGTIVPLSLNPNENVLTIVSAGVGSSSPTTVQVDFLERNSSQSSVIIGSSTFQGNLTIGQAVSRTIGLPKIVIDGARSPYAAQHVLDVPDPQILTVLRTGSTARRRLNVDNYVERNGLTPEFFEVDEVPFASTAEGSSGRASTRPIPSSDNQSAGRQFGLRINDYGGLRLNDGQSIDLQATVPDYENSRNIPTRGLPDFSPLYGIIGTDREGKPIGDVIDGVLGEDNLIYGTAGGDVLRGAEDVSGDDVDYILGDLGNDSISGKSGDDVLLGQGGNDLIYGDGGSDLIYGGPGIDALFGDSGDGEPDVQASDIFVIRRNEGADLIADFQLGSDRIALADGLKFADLIFDPIRASNLLSFEEAAQEAQSLSLGGGEPIKYPDFRGPVEVVTFGARIKDRRNDKVLAFVNGPIGEVLNDPDNFIEQPGGSRTTLRGIL